MIRLVVFEKMETPSSMPVIVKEVAIARQIAMYLSKKRTKASLKTIVLHFGGRDHSTVVHAFNNIESIIDKDLDFKETIDTLRNKIELNAA